MLPLIWGLLSKPPYVGLNKTTCADFLRMAVFGRFRCRCRCNSRRLWCNSKRLWCSSRHPWCSSSRAWCRGISLSFFFLRIVVFCFPLFLISIYLYLSLFRCISLFSFHLFLSLCISIIEYLSLWLSLSLSCLHMIIWGIYRYTRPRQHTFSNKYTSTYSNMRKPDATHMHTNTLTHTHTHIHTHTHTHTHIVLEWVLLASSSSSSSSSSSVRVRWRWDSHACIYACACIYVRILTACACNLQYNIYDCPLFVDSVFHLPLSPPPRLQLFAPLSSLSPPVFSIRYGAAAGRLWRLWR